MANPAIIGAVTVAAIGLFMNFALHKVEEGMQNIYDVFDKLVTLT